jgi:lactoylglutathione lyase
MFQKIDYIMVNVTDMTRSVAFYRDTLGLPLKFESPGWSEFETGASTLALHAVSSRGAADGGGEPKGGTCTLGFSVSDLDATYSQLKDRGARFVVTPKDQVNEGIRLAVCLDPDGLAVSFAQPLPK